MTDLQYFSMRICMYHRDMCSSDVYLIIDYVKTFVDMFGGMVVSTTLLPAPRIPSALHKKRFLMISLRTPATIHMILTHFGARVLPLVLLIAPLNLLKMTVRAKPKR